MNGCKVNRAILIVDDNEADRVLISETLSEALVDIDLIQAATGEEGIRLAQQENPDLILMDIMLPKMSGGDAVKVLRADKRTDNIPVVFLSGIASEGNQGCINVGGDFFDSISKPFDNKQLITTIQKFLQED